MHKEGEAGLTKGSGGKANENRMTGGRDSVLLLEIPRFTPPHPGHERARGGLGGPVQQGQPRNAAVSEQALGARGL